MLSSEIIKFGRLQRTKVILAFNNSSTRSLVEDHITSMNYDYPCSSVYVVELSVD